MSFNLNVSYKEKKTIAETAAEPVISFPKQKGMFYTILMYDPDAPAGTWLHMLKMNVSSGDEHGNVVMSYMGPSPPAGSGSGPQGTHHYITSVYEQHGYVNSLPTYNIRAKFDVDGLVKKYQLQHLGSSTFTVDAKPVQGGKRRKTIKRRKTKKQSL
jgi:phosphatidylethanolamine-binding protein (PEBP) family uncharacterized protein